MLVWQTSQSRIIDYSMVHNTVWTFLVPKAAIHIVFFIYQGQKYIATFWNSYANSVIYSSGRPITLHKWRKLELNIIILYPQRHKKTKLRPFCGLKKGHLISYTHSYQKYVCTYGWVLSVKKNFWFKSYLGEYVKS